MNYKLQHINNLKWDSQLLHDLISPTQEFKKLGSTDFPMVIIESDSLTACDIIIHRSSDASAFANLISQCHNLIYASIWEVKIYLIYRYINATTSLVNWSRIKFLCWTLFCTI